VDDLTERPMPRTCGVRKHRVPGGGSCRILVNVGDFMKFCTGWYPHHDAQRMYRDGGALAAPDFQDQLKQLADLRDAGVASEDELFVERVRILSRT
jgi:hypothetical protein